MTSAGHRRRGGEDADEQTGVRFFKIILQSTLDDKKLLLPRKFIRDSAGELLNSTSATLKLPTGDEWEVELVKEGEEDVCFRSNGWERFAEFYSLLYGNFLVFEYSGGSEFSVIIFGRTATEIEYPVREVVIKIEDSSESSMEVVDAAVATLKANDKGKSPMVAAGEGNNNNSKGKKQKRCWKESEELESKGGFSKKVRAEVEEKPSASSCSRKRRDSAVNWLAMGQSSFEMLVTKSYFATGMYIPQVFAEEHINKTERELKLECGGKEWTIGLLWVCNKYVKLGHGWKKFKDDTELAPGDYIKLELVSRWVNVKLKVTIMKKE